MTTNENDSVWDELLQGPTTALDETLDINDTTTAISNDDIITLYAKEWFNMMQSIYNISIILNKIVKKYTIYQNGHSLEPLPSGIAHLYKTADNIKKVHDSLYETKRIIFIIAAIRKEWGTIDAFINASESEREEWYERSADLIIQQLFL